MKILARIKNRCKVNLCFRTKLPNYVTGKPYTSQNHIDQFKLFPICNFHARKSLWHFSAKALIFICVGKHLARKRTALPADSSVNFLNERCMPTEYLSYMPKVKGSIELSVSFSFLIAHEYTVRTRAPGRVYVFVWFIKLEPRSYEK